MTRINTNVSSLVAQNTLGRSSTDLQQALTRLSTGLRINSGKDDPAGLIASDALRADMISIEKAISNSTRANLMIATADSALGQVSNLLNDIRGLVVEAANSGALSSAQIDANQLQVDSSLEAINRIAQTTTFQGRRLLDGSLDFTTNANTVATIADMQIDQANLGLAGRLAVEVDIQTGATVAEVRNTDGFTTGTNAQVDIQLTAGIEIENGATGSFLRIKALELGASTVGVAFVDSNDSGGVVNDVAYDGSTITVTGDFTTGIAVADVAAAINADTDTSSLFNASSAGAGDFTTADGDASGGAGVDHGTLGADTIRLTAQATGADFNGVRVSVVAGTGNNAVYDATQNTLTVTVDNSASQTTADLAADIDTALDGYFDAAVQATSSGVVDTSVEAVEQTQSTGNTGGNVLKGDLVLSVGGSIGRDVFNFQAGASVNQVVAAINLVGDATGVVASQENGTLVLNSVQYGTKGIVDTEVIDEDENGEFEASWVDDLSRATGTDIEATVNGVRALGDGNTLSINTATLDLLITVDDGSDANFVLDITGGGALFQLGPDVVSNQQARMGIQSLYTAKLGGASGRMYELASGGAKALTTDPSAAFRVVSDVIGKVGTLRGRLGAFQRTTVETNIASLTDTLVNLTDAESSIRDADFAKESSALTRAQILVQSGTAVLAIANSTPQSVLSLLR